MTLYDPIWLQITISTAKKSIAVIWDNVEALDNKISYTIDLQLSFCPFFVRSHKRNLTYLRTFLQTSTTFCLDILTDIKDTIWTWNSHNKFGSENWFCPSFEKAVFFAFLTVPSLKATGGNFLYLCLTFHIFF